MSNHASLSRQFTQLAEDFRSILASLAPGAFRPVSELSASGARLCKRASDAGLLHLADIEWPLPDDANEWARCWGAIVYRLRCDRELTRNPWGIRDEPLPYETVAVDWGEVEVSEEYLRPLVLGYAETADWLARHVQRGGHGNLEDTPSWDRIKGELSFDGETVKRIRRIGIAKNVVQVLDTFQELDWPDRVDSPLSSPNSQKHHATISSLNTDLSRIRFRSDGEGKGFIWKTL